MSVSNSLSSWIGNLSLRAKLTSAIAGLLLAISVFLFVFFPWQMDRSSRDLLFRDLITVLGRASQPGVEFGDSEYTTTLLGSLQDSGVVTYAVLRRGDGTVLGAWRPENQPTDLGLTPTSNAQAAEPVERDGQLHSAILVIPGHGSAHGALHMGFSLAKVAELRRTNMLIVGAVSALIFLIGLAISLVLGRALALPIRNMTDVSLRIAAGDISQPKMAMARRDEVGQMAAAFDRMIEAQRLVVTEISEIAAQIVHVATEIYSASHEQETASAEQSTAVEEVTQTVRSLLGSAGHIAESAQGVLANAEKTRGTTDITASKIAELSNHTNRIAEILEIIRDIADRSDLLALNASLEATRAGESGRSFSLVAVEMRRLAERVTASVADVKSLVADVRSSSSSTVLATEENRKLAESTTDSARQITLVTQQQKTATEQVSQSMVDISQVLSQAVTVTQQTRNSAEGLKKLSERLSHAVSSYKLS